MTAAAMAMRRVCMVSSLAAAGAGIVARQLYLCNMSAHGRGSEVRSLIVRLLARERGLFAGAAVVAAACAALGVPFEFVLFGLTLTGVALFHHHTLQVALIGLGAIVLYKLAFTGFKAGPGMEGLALHMLHEWVILANLFGLLLGFALLSNYFEASQVPAVLPRYPPITQGAAAGARVDWPRVAIVASILLAAIIVNVIVNVKFSAYSDRFPFIGAGVWAAISIAALWRRPAWSLLPGAFKGSVFLLSLIVCASLMPVEKLPAASWQTALGLGFVSAVFDNIPLTALALKQGGYDWGYLAYAVGFGGSMIWFGSSAGVALSNMYPQAKSVGLWLKHGWHVALAYVIGFFVLYAVLGWHPNAPHKAKPAAALQTPGAAVYGMTSLPCGCFEDESRIPAPSRMSVQGFTLPIIRIQREETTNEQSATVAPQIPDRRGRGRRGNARLPGDRQGAGPDLDALAEHLALEGHLPRVRARLRQESERHDRRRSQDRGAARRRRGACIRPARRGLQGNARRRPRRAGLPLRQAECAGAVGIEPRVRHGRQHFACLAQIRWRQGAAQQALQLDRRERGVVPVRTDADAAAWLVQEADYQARRLQGPQVPHSGHLDRPVPGHGRGGERAAGQRDRAGDRPRPAGRRGVQ